MPKKTPPHTTSGNPTPWDLFLAVGIVTSCTREDLVRTFWLRDSKALDASLDKALADKLIQARGPRLEIRADSRARNLARAVQVALSYGIDYNAYTHPELKAALQKGYGQPWFGLEDPDPALLRTLIEDGMLVAYSYNPPVYRMVQNPFLEALGAFLGLKLPPAATLEAPLVAAMRGERVKALRTRQRLPDLPKVRRGLTVFQRLLRLDLLRGEAGILDPEGLRRLRACLETVRSNIAAGLRLTPEVIRDYHVTLMGDSPDAGRLRTNQVTVVNNPYFRTAPPEQVEELLEEMVDRYRRRRPEALEDLVHDAAWLGNEVLYIHPFEDGNTRAARAVLAHFLGENASPLREVPPAFDMLFLLGSKGSRSRNDEALAEVVWDMIIHTVNRAELAARATG